MAKKVNGLNLLAGMSSMKVEDVPLAPGVDVAAIQEGDTSPLQVVVEIPAGKSKRGWNYKPQALKDIVAHVMTDTLNGFLGHQKAENVATEFPQIQTHWVGALYNDQSNKAYFRGVIDPGAPNLKRWIKSKRIKQVSIFGQPKLQRVGGEVEVVGYKPFSIDWTPLDRPGMPTAVVAVGEMATIYDGFELEFDGQVQPVDISGELDGSFEDLGNALRVALREHFGEKSYPYPRKTYPDYAIVSIDSESGTKLYKVSYGVVDDKVVLGKITEVSEVVSYKPVGEQAEGGEQSMNKADILKALQEGITSGEIAQEDLLPVVGEMFTGTQLSAEMAEAIGSNDPKAIKEALAFKAQADKDAAQKAVGEMVTALIGEKVKGETAQAFVKEAFTPVGNTKELLAGELDAFLERPSIKTTLQKMYGVHSVFNRGEGSETGTTGTRSVKRAV